jgi:hypothetical protein
MTITIKTRKKRCKKDCHLYVFNVTLGSIELYDAKQQKWVSYISDPEKWYQHFKDIRDGYDERDFQGRYIVGSGAKHRRMAEMETLQKTEDTPEVQLVTPVAQAVEMAMSELKLLQKESNAKRKRFDINIPILKKHRATQALND